MNSPPLRYPGAGGVGADPPVARSAAVSVVVPGGPRRGPALPAHPPAGPLRGEDGQAEGVP